jgi:hypothetical protein
VSKVQPPTVESRCHHRAWTNRRRSRGVVRHSSEETALLHWAGDAATSIIYSWSEVEDKALLDVGCELLPVAALVERVEPRTPYALACHFELLRSVFGYQDYAIVATK